MTLIRMPLSSITLGPTPCDESCAQVGEDNYLIRAHAESTVYKAQLQRIVDVWKSKHPASSPPNGEAFLRLVEHPHDYGSYVEVSIVFNSESRGACNLASYLENNLPAEWDAEARVALSAKVG